MGLSEPQEQRFMRAYDISKEVMRELGIFPAKGNEEQERIAMDIDEFERGYPRLTLSIMMDVVGACRRVAETPKREGKDKDVEKPEEFTPYNESLNTPEGKAALRN